MPALVAEVARTESRAARALRLSDEARSLGKQARDDLVTEAQLLIVDIDELVATDVLSAGENQVLGKISRDIAAGLTTLSGIQARAS